MYSTGYVLMILCVNSDKMQVVERRCGGVCTTIRRRIIQEVIGGLRNDQERRDLSVE